MSAPTNRPASASERLPIWQAVLVILTPVWIILATLAHGIVAGEVTL